MIYHSPATSTAIVRVAREQHRLARAALALVSALPGPWRTPCVVRVARVSGTVRKAEEAAVEDATRALRRARGVRDGGGGAVLGEAGLVGLVAEGVGRGEGRVVWMVRKMRTRTRMARTGTVRRGWIRIDARCVQ